MRATLQFEETALRDTHDLLPGQGAAVQWRCRVQNRHSAPYANGGAWRGASEAQDANHPFVSSACAFSLSEEQAPKSSPIRKGANQKPATSQQGPGVSSAQLARAAAGVPNGGTSSEGCTFKSLPPAAGKDRQDNQGRGPASGFSNTKPVITRAPTAGPEVGTSFADAGSGGSCRHRISCAPESPSLRNGTGVRTTLKEGAA